MKKNTKKKTKKVKKVKKVARASKHEIVVRVETPRPISNLPVVVTPDALLPEKDGKKLVLTKSWVSQSQVLKMLQKTPPQHILKRKGKGNMTFDYVTGIYMKKVLNFVFAWNWDFEIVKQELVGAGQQWAQIITTGKLTVKDDAGHSITKFDNGKAEVKFKKDTVIPMDIGNDYKASATDALKRCAAQLGIASDVYGKSEFREQGVDVKEPIAPQQPPTTTPNQDGVDESFEDHVCVAKGCGRDLTVEEAKYSKKMYGKELCREHQKEEAEKRKQK